MVGYLEHYKANMVFRGSSKAAFNVTTTVNVTTTNQKSAGAIKHIAAVLFYGITYSEDIGQ